MDITLYISRFLYRIRHQLIFGTLIVTALVAYFSQFMEKKYTVTTSIYTGITSNTGLDEETKPDWQAVNNTYDFGSVKESEERIFFRLGKVPVSAMVWAPSPWVKYSTNL